MYSTLPLKRLLTFLALPPLVIFLVIGALCHFPQNFAEGWSLAKSVVSGWGLFLVVIGSGSKRWAPWRWIWLIPGFQRYVFPDLNGTWTGQTSSNWPSIKAMLDCYSNGQMAGAAGALDQIPLQEDGIEIVVTASFFRFRIDAKLTRTAGTSHSTSARVNWNDHLERYEICYLYLQGTPTPLLTDEASHLGAANLVLDMQASSLKGEYWTKRSWRSGLNTAGLIEVSRTKRW
jgi:hypothetical protein